MYGSKGGGYISFWPLGEDDVTTETPQLIGSGVGPKLLDSSGLFCELRAPTIKRSVTTELWVQI